MIFKNPSWARQEKGVSLIITFFILTIILAVVISISALLYGQVKIIRNIGNSVVAFYAADSGMEKILYYDRKKIPIGGTRGICNICNTCSSCITGINGDSGNCIESNCYSCFINQISLNGCDPLTCSDCHIVFSSKIDTSKSYNMDITINQQCKKSFGTINSYGFYKDVSRAIRLDSAIKVSSLKISSSGATATTQGTTGLKMTISADILDPNNVGIDSIVVVVRGVGSETENQCNNNNGVFSGGDCIYRELGMSSGGGGGKSGSYQVQWNFGLQDVTYNINIMATDNQGDCVEVSNITISYQ